MKDELLPQSTKGMDLFLANLTAKCNNELLIKYHICFCVSCKFTKVCKKNYQPGFPK